MKPAQVGLIRRAVAIGASIPLIVYALGVPVALLRFHAVFLSADRFIPFELAGLCVCASLVVGALAVPSGVCLALMKPVHRWLAEPVPSRKGYALLSHVGRRLRRRNVITDRSQTKGVGGDPD